MKYYFSKLFVLFLVISLWVSSCSSDDENSEIPIRYFRFSSCSTDTHGNWQDTTFIAATRNMKVIEQCLKELSISKEERSKFPLGEIDGGDGGHNRNGPHSFSWHFKEDSWEMVEVGVEIYDGCAYTDAELGNFLENLGSYGGWENRIVEEIVAPN